MKTAISLPDDLFHRAEGFAQKHNFSWSELYTRALDAYLKAQEQAEIPPRLNELYETESSEPDPALVEIIRLPSNSRFGVIESVPPASVGGSILAKSKAAH